MSAREPLWFCHECHAEMRPLMVPDPVCASCHGSFVEKMENPSDDPREFAHDLGDLDGPEAGMPQGADALLFTLQSIMDRGIARNAQRTNGGPAAVTFEVRGPSGTRTVRLGGGNMSGGSGTRLESPGPVPNMSTFLGSQPQGFGGQPGGRDRPDISGPLMAQYLMSLLGGQQDLGLFGGPENGRMGDYVFNQEALDQIITQIMDNSNAHRPVPATEEIIKNLPREVLMVGSATLEQDCAVCKDQFKLETEDPDEQIVVTLPCKHPFHEPCITPWLKSSGTCPVCRHALVPQPDHHPPPTRGPEVDSGGDGRQMPPNPGSGPSNLPRSGGNRGPEPGGLFQSIFGNLTGHLGHHTQHSRESSSSGNRSGARSPTGSNSHARPQSPQSPHRRSNSDPASGRSSSSPPSNGRQGHSGGNNNVPGSWSEDLD
ncbi:hypothetical protein GALMADRAFT_234790 [Galerina marginata CBS 339.88]|uniref:RING-type domain-containing protein n=1 Tax=Galerina marginata (strain CBS 339.88) TaxID=685588 RepID=A0A067TRA8_GALM3|nr:hypothetical protein GALMADRAFT_234790 [Galerina marginata CBS 339.88]